MTGWAYVVKLQSESPVALLNAWLHLFYSLQRWRKRSPLMHCKEGLVFTRLGSNFVSLLLEL